MPADDVRQRLLALLVSPPCPRAVEDDAMRIDVERVTTLKAALFRSGSSRFENCMLQDAIRAFDAVVRGAAYHFVPPSVQTMWQRIADAHGDDVLAIFNQLLLLTLIEDFDVRIRTRRYPQSIIDQFHLNFRRIVSDIASNGSDSYRLRNDRFMKDLAICRQKLIPAGAEVLEEYSGIPRSTVIAGGPAQFAAFLVFLVSHGGGRFPFYEYHTHLSTLEDFNPAGFDAFYVRVADLLKLNPEHRGLIATSWFLDPVLERISPRLAYIRTRPMQHGAKLFVVGPDADGSAICRSATRRKLYEEGEYKPMAYRIVWPRPQLIAWAASQAT